MATQSNDRLHQSEGNNTLDTVNLTRQEPEEQDINNMDTVALARDERRKQGCFEAELSYGGEADLHKHLDACDKNPGHLKFVPVNQFNIDHLPPGYNGDDLVELVQVISHLTVRVSVKYVSEERPETFPGSDKPYPCYTNRGSDMMRVGTGYVNNVFIYPMEVFRNKETCDCKECLNSPTPKTQFAKIDIYTAAHVVFNSLEGQHTTCHLFFDRGSTPDHCSDVITLSGMSHVLSNIDSDWCWMTYVTHDINLADRLDKMVSCRSDLINSVIKRYNPRNSLSPLNNRQESRQETDVWEKLTILVSHPHGCSKQVSVGQCTDREEMEDRIIDGIKYERSMYTYTTATCPGSSGAPIFLLRWGCSALASGHVHSGNCEENCELNHSCYENAFLKRKTHKKNQ